MTARIVTATKPRPRRKPPPRGRGNVPTIVRPLAVSIDRKELARRAAAADEIWRELIRRASEAE